jgi:tetratricopeptide (TPR) repeat protein
VSDIIGRGLCRRIAAHRGRHCQNRRSGDFCRNRSGSGNTLLYLLYKRASITGDLAALSALERDIERAIPLLAHPGDLYLLKAHTALKLHKLAQVQAALVALTAIYESSEGRLIRADLDFQHGRYQLAEESYSGVQQAERSWGGLARLAYLYGKMGDEPAADRLYEEAQDQLTAKEMRSYAWLEVQRGSLDFAHGRLDAARLHYQRAATAYPDYWLVDEHIAELLGAEGEYGNAIAILERNVSMVRRPEVEQAIGELYDLSGCSEMALQWKQRALAAYLESARRGEVHYYHHLADYYLTWRKTAARPSNGHIRTSAYAKISRFRGRSRGRFTATARPARRSLDR